MLVNKVKSHWNEQWNMVVTKLPTKNCNYYISDYGRLKSEEKTTGEEKLLKGSTLKRSGLLTLNLKLIEKKTQTLYVHRFVAAHFVEKENEEQKFVVHLDLNKKNNYWKNLMWKTREELTKWQTEKGVYEKENRKKSSAEKMTESKVRLLKSRLREGKTKKKIIARSFGISTVQLNKIEKGENWGNVN